MNRGGHSLAQGGPGYGRVGRNERVSEPAGWTVDYGNWVSSRLVLVPTVLAVLFGATALLLLPVLGVLAAFFFLCALYFAYARYMFSPRGGSIQTKVQYLVLDHLAGWEGVGKVLDIGCGNAPLTIEIAKAHPEAEVVGVDYWSSGWEYSVGVCERNAEVEGVGGRVAFERASAVSLPYADEAFDVVVSNLVFHNIRVVKDNRELVREALRVLKKGGRFVLQDLFLWKRVYGDTDELLAAIKSWGVETVAFVDASRSDFIPTVLKLPFMLGTVGIIHGRK
jgi:SAM-dependent methyltransferase